MNQDYFTDVITFDYSKEMTLIGDVFISTERVKENAKLFNVSFNEELFRVIIHGVLHLLGYDHKNSYEAKIMEALEVKILKNQLSFKDLMTSLKQPKELTYLINKEDTDFISDYPKLTISIRNTLKNNIIDL